MRYKNSSNLIGKSGFSLVEVLTSLAILSFMMVILFSALNSIQTTWVREQNSLEKYKTARVALETLDRRLANATLNTYWGYDDPEAPTEYAPQSELHFVSGPMDELVSPGVSIYSGHGIFFQAPFGYGGTEAGIKGGGVLYDKLQKALNCWGYYVEYYSDLESDRKIRPDFIPTTNLPEKKRFRLMEFRLPTEKLEIFSDQYSSNGSINEAKSKEDIRKWFADETTRRLYSSPVTDNILAIIFTPRAPGLFSAEGHEIAPAFSFDSRRYQWDDKDSELSVMTRHQVPPVIDISLIALSEGSWIAMESQLDADKIQQLQNLSRTHLTSPEMIEQDLETIGAQLDEIGLEYKVISTSTSLRSGKWIIKNN